MDAEIIVRAGGNPPRVSVAVCSRDRSHLLGRLVRCLEQQTMPLHDFEVVIIDDASDDATPGELRVLAEHANVRITAARLPAQSGPAVGRNAAWRAARGQIVAFTDDDCQPTSGWLEGGIAALDAGAGIVVGRVMPDPQQLHQLGPFSRTMYVEDERYLSTCNIFYRRSDLEAVGGFDEAFPPRAGGGEDTDLGWRVQKQLRRKTAFAADALVHHDVRPSRFRAKVRETLRWTGIARLVALHPEEGRRMLHRRLFWRSSHPTAILAASGLMIALRFWPAAVLVLPWLRIRTKGVRSRRWLASLPGILVIDTLEVGVMIRGSIQNRTLVL